MNVRGSQHVLIASTASGQSSAAGFNEKRIVKGTNGKVRMNG